MNVDGANSKVNFIFFGAGFQLDSDSVCSFIPGKALHSARIAVTSYLLFEGGVEFKREIPLICDLICIPPPLEYKEAVRVWNNSICGWRNVLSEVFAATFGLCNTGRQVSLILFVFHPPWNTLGEHWKSVSLIAFWTILRFTIMTFWHSSGSFSVVAHGSFWCNQIPSWMDPSCRTCCDLGMQLNSYATAIS